MVSWFLQGLGHPLATPAHLLVLVALGLLAGQQGKATLARVWLAYALAAALGLVATRFLGAGDGQLTLLVLGVCLGGLVALQWRVPLPWMLALALACGAVLGLDSAVAALPGIRVGRIYLQLAGSGVAQCLLLAVAGGLALVLHKLWDGIAVRVLGAWVTAGATMVLALLLSGLLK